MIQWIKHNGSMFGDNAYVQTLSIGKKIGQLIDEDETRHILDEHEQERVMLCLYTGMATGKSTYAEDILGVVALERNMRVLYVSPRRVLIDQIEDDYNKYHSIEERLFKARADFTCYQPLLDTLKSKKGLEHLQNDYDIIVFDEFHQPFSDSSFIEEVEPLMKWILNTRQFVVVLSATYDIPMERIKHIQAKKYVLRQEIDFSEPTIKFKLGTESAIVDYLEKNKDKSVFICQYKLFKGKFPTPITQYCLDNKDELNLKTRVGDSWGANSDYDEESVKIIKKLNTKVTNKLMPSRTLLASSIFSTGTELFGYVDENGEVVDKIDIVVVNFLDIDELKQAIRRVRVFHDMEILIVCHERPTLNGALQQIKNIYSDIVLDFFEEDFKQGTRTKLDSWIEENDNRTSLPNGLYVEIGTGRILLNYTEISNVYLKLQRFQDIERVALGLEKRESKRLEQVTKDEENGQVVDENNKKRKFYKNSSQPHREYIRSHFIQECNCSPKQFETLYSKEDFVDDKEQVDKYLTELFTDELANRQYNKQGEFIGVLISTDKQQLKQFAKNIGSVTERKEPSAKKETVNKTLEQYGLDKKWRVERRQVRDGNKRPSGLMLIQVKEEQEEQE